MTGKMIDRAALTALGVAGLYGFFLNAGLGVAASGALAFACAVLARYVWARRPRSRRVTAAQAEAALWSIATMKEAEAREALAALTGAPGAIFLLRHPDATLTLGELFGIWRERGGDVSVVATCAAEPGAVQFASRMGMALTDRGGLVRRIRKTGLYVPEKTMPEPVLNRLRQLWARLRARPLRPGMIAYAAGLLGMYLATGRALCLLCALGLLGFAGAKLIDRLA